MQKARILKCKPHVSLKWSPASGAVANPVLWKQLQKSSRGSAWIAWNPPFQLPAPKIPARPSEHQIIWFNRPLTFTWGGVIQKLDQMPVSDRVLYGLYLRSKRISVPRWQIYQNRIPAGDKLRGSRLNLLHQLTVIAASAEWTTENSWRKQRIPSAVYITNDYSLQFLSNHLKIFQCIFNRRRFYLRTL